jgi:hypothetical protein
MNMTKHMLIYLLIFIYGWVGERSEIVEFENEIIMIFLKNCFWNCPRIDHTNVFLQSPIHTIHCSSCH